VLNVKVKTPKVIIDEIVSIDPDQTDNQAV
jgi:hypothetical protein